MYAYLAVFAYLLYGLGYITPYLRADLHLSDFTAGLHATALAVGTLGPGFTADALTRRLGSRRVVVLAVALCGLATLLIVLAPVLPVSLLGAACLGYSGGTLGTYVNVTLGGSGDAFGRKLLARANAWAMASSAVAPVVIAAAASVAHNWRLAIVLAVVGLVAVLLVSPKEGHAAAAGHATGRIPRRFWPAWLFIALAVAVEFSFVFWSSTLVAHRTGVSTDTATFLASLFVAGMLAGRVALGFGEVAARPPRLLIAAGIAIAAAGAAVAWVSTEPALSAVGVFLGGFGTGGLYPVGVAVALRAADGAQISASARLTLASGLAIFAAPSLLGLASDAVGVTAGWSLVFAFALAAFVLGLVTTQPEAVAPAATAATPAEVPAP